MTSFYAMQMEAGPGLGCALDYLSLKQSVDYVHTYVGTRRQSCAVLYLVHDAQEVHVRGNDLLN